jgi:hypothetical protein
MMFGDTTVGATTVGVTTVGATTVGATTVGATTVGETTVGATTVGLTTVGETTVGVTTVGETHGVACASHWPSGSASGAGPLTVPNAKTPPIHSVTLMPSRCTRKILLLIYPTMRPNGMAGSTIPFAFSSLGASFYGLTINSPVGSSTPLVKVA